ncbi:MAG: hypothetical protein DRQ46_07760 [Gammaproteobacteria bacterium]|nr:MAG: hypothetical protein DRQ46_07760 [Gammaproteobacteria bacterium]
MIETENKKIDDVQYKVSQMDAIRGLTVQTKLIKLLGPALGKTLLSGKDDQDTLKDKAFGHLVSNFDDKEISSLIIGLFDKGVYFIDQDGDDAQVDFKRHFTGNPGAVWKVTFFILEVNFGDLLGKLTGGLSHLKKTVSDSLKET